MQKQIWSSSLAILFTAVSGATSSYRYQTTPEPATFTDRFLKAVSFQSGDRCLQDGNYYNWSPELSACQDVTARYNGTGTNVYSRNDPQIRWVASAKMPQLQCASLSNPSATYYYYNYVNFECTEDSRAKTVQTDALMPSDCISKNSKTSLKWDSINLKCKHTVYGEVKEDILNQEECASISTSGDDFMRNAVALALFIVCIPLAICLACTIAMIAGPACPALVVGILAMYCILFISWYFGVDITKLNQQGEEGSEGDFLSELLRQWNTASAIGNSATTGTSSTSTSSASTSSSADSTSIDTSSFDTSSFDTSSFDTSSIDMPDLDLPSFGFL